MKFTCPVYEQRKQNHLKVVSRQLATLPLNRNLIGRFTGAYWKATVENVHVGAVQLCNTMYF